MPTKATVRDPESVKYELGEAEGELSNLQDREWELEDEIAELKKELKLSEDLFCRKGLSEDEFLRARKTELNIYKERTGRDYAGPLPDVIIVSGVVTGTPCMANMWLEKVFEELEAE